MSNLTEYQTDHLFLLIGTNPLPNYVAGRLLAKPEARIYLVHSAETYDIARRLAVSLECRHCEWLQVDDTDAQDIFHKVSEKARGKDSIGLNYTGGTKVMATHAYRAIENAHYDAVFSYVDARTLQLVAQRGQSRALRHSIGIQVQIALEALLRMHGYTLKQAPTIAPIFPREATDLAQFDCQQFRRWCDEQLRSEGRLKRDSDLRDVSIEHIPALPDWSALGTLQHLASSRNKKVKELALWLDGRWLEDYVLLTIQRIADQCRIHDCASHVEPRERNFEFDVVAMRGYQLFAISCTTSSRSSEIKIKLFEAYVRARQMGGDEARVAVVSCIPSQDSNRSPLSIQRELEEAWDAEGKIRVFGAEHIPDLTDHMRDWFDSQP